MESLPGAGHGASGPFALLLRAAPWALGGVSVLLAAGLALMGVSNRRNMEIAAGQAYEGRALDIGLGTAAALWMLRPRGRSALVAALKDLAHAPVLSLAVIGPHGKVLASSTLGEGVAFSGMVRTSRALRQEGAMHYLERLSGGDRPRYRVWILLRPGLRPGLRRFDRLGRGGSVRGRWRQEPRESFQGEQRSGGRGAVEDHRWRSPDSDAPWRGDPGGPATGALQRDPAGRTLGRALVAVDVEIDDPRIAAAVSRARGVQWISLAASGALLFFALVAFLAERRAARWRRRMARERRLAEMGEMAAVLAHEIRNPLGVIKGYAQLLGEGASGEEAGTLEAVVAETARLERLVNGLLDFARPAPPRRREVPLKELLLRACELAAEEAANRQVRLVTDLAPLDAEVDPDQLLQVLLNLLRNAVEASSPGEVVTLRCRRQGGAALIQVVDMGKGLPSDLGEDIFKPFVTGRPKGTGLGLAVCRQIVEAHGGALTARNGQERGAVFDLRLPLRASVAGALDASGGEP